jgi:uncharacterized protein Yka (UPF0111/DUF47 family)
MMKRTNVQRALRGLSHGGGGRPLIATLERQLDEVRAACRLARDVAACTIDSAAAREQMNKIEHKGDTLRAALVHELADVLVAPIDREDMFRLSRSIDDVLDNIRDFVREVDMYCMTAADSFTGPLEVTATAIEDLRAAVHTIIRDPNKTGEATLAAKKSANEIRRRYDEEVALLFQGSLSMDMLKRRELLRRLDVVGLRLNEAADALSDAVVKRRA